MFEWLSIEAPHWNEAISFIENSQRRKMLHSNVLASFGCRWNDFTLFKICVSFRESIIYLKDVCVFFLCIKLWNDSPSSDASPHCGQLTKAASASRGITVEKSSSSLHYLWVHDYVTMTTSRTQWKWHQEAPTVESSSAWIALTVDNGPKPDTGSLSI